MPYKRSTMRIFPHGMKITSNVKKADSCENVGLLPMSSPLFGIPDMKIQAFYGICLLASPVLFFLLVVVAGLNEIVIQPIWRWIKK